SSATVAGNAPSATRVAMPSPAVAYSRNAHARSWFSLAAGIASELPPFSDVTCSPASHCGIGATAQSPEADSTDVSRLPRIQAPMTRLAIEPSARPWYHSSLHDVTGA